MSKYTEAETKIKKIMCEEIDRLPSHFDGEDEVYDSIKDVDEILKLNKTICKALQTADRLEQALDAISNEEIQIKACGRYGCLEKECPIRARDKFCYDLAGIFFDGYKQALADVRGDAE